MRHPDRQPARHPVDENPRDTAAGLGDQHGIIAIPGAPPPVVQENAGRYGKIAHGAAEQIGADLVVHERAVEEEQHPDTLPDPDGRPHPAPGTIGKVT